MSKETIINAVKAEWESKTGGNWDWLVDARQKELIGEWLWRDPAQQKKWIEENLSNPDFVLNNTPELQQIREVLEKIKFFANEWQDDLIEEMAKSALITLNKIMGE